MGQDAALDRHQGGISRKGLAAVKVMYCGDVPAFAIICVGAPGLMVTAEEVPVIVPVTVSVAVTVREPAELSVTENVFTPVSPATKV